MSSSSDDSSLLQLVGSSIDNNMSRLAAQTLFYGFFLVLFGYTVALYWTRGLQSSSSRIMLAVTILAFISATAHWGASVAFDLIQVREMLIYHTEMSLSDRVALGDTKLFKPDLAQYWCGMLMPLISDAVVVWRAWYLYEEHRYVMMLPLLPLFADFGVTITFLSYLCKYDNWFTFASGDTTQSIYKVMTALQQASFTLSFGINAITTLLIAYQLWKYRSFLKQLWGIKSAHRRGDRTVAERVLAVMVESGFVYAIFQAAFVGLAFGPTPTQAAAAYAAELFLTIYTQLSAIYPLLVLCIVKLQLSIADQQSSSGMVSTVAFSDGSERDRTASGTGHRLSYPFPTPSSHTATDILPMHDLDSQGPEKNLKVDAEKAV